MTKPRAWAQLPRRCLVSGHRVPRQRLIRFVLDGDGRPVPDPGAKLPGRGMWLSADAETIKTACRKRLFDRAAGRRVVVPENPATLAASVEVLLVRRCLMTLSLARRAGEAVAGFEKVRAALTAANRIDGGNVRRCGDGAEKADATTGDDDGDDEADAEEMLSADAVFITARDGAVGGRAKLAGAVAGRTPVRLFDAAELGTAFGRPHIVHALIAPGGLARNFRRDAMRLDGFRDVGSADGCKTDG